MIATVESSDIRPTTTEVRMVRGEIRGRELQRWMGSRRLQDTDHALHCLLVECFGDLAPKPFRAIMDRKGLKGVLYGYGTADTDQLRESAAICADPLQSRILPPESLQDKAMPSRWTTGKRLGFEVRVRPVVRLRRELDRVPPDKLRRFRQRGSGGEIEFMPRPGMECDAFQWAALLTPEGEKPLTREEIYVQWLAERLAHDGAAELEAEETRLVSFQRLRSFRKLRSRYVEGPDALMRGGLTVADPIAFASLLARGVGRHRAYGYGMLLLRPLVNQTGNG